MQKGWGVRHIIAIIILAGFMVSCDRVERPERISSAGSEAFCETLRVIRRTENKFSEVPNELFGHTENLKRLYEVSPDEIAEDLLALYTTFSDTRDSEDTDTLRGFQALSDTKLAGQEGRIAVYAKQICNIVDGDTRYKVDPAFKPGSLCPGWPQSGSPLTNNRFPYLLDTSSANYFSTIFFSGPFGVKKDGLINIPAGGRATLKGSFPYAKYFGFHPNDMSTNNFPTLMDETIDPDVGSYNPWRESGRPEQDRNYTVHFVMDAPPQVVPRNTVYIGEQKNGERNRATFLLLRVYGADLPPLPPHSAGVDLPAITVYDKKGKQIAHYPACEPYPEGYDVPADGTMFPAFPLPDHRAQSQAGRFDLSSNFGIDVDLLSNADVLYLNTFYGREHGDIFAVRFKKPKTVNHAQNLYPWSQDLDFRMWTACTYNFWNGAAHSCVTAEDIATDETGYLTMVISEKHLRPANATAQEGVTWLEAGNFLDGQLSLRMLPRSAPFLERLKKDVTKLDFANPYVPQTAFCSKSVFEEGGFDACASFAEK